MVVVTEYFWKMEVLTNLLGFVLFYLTFSSLTVYAQESDKCLKKTSCSCEFSNGTGIDLTQSSNASFFTAQKYYLTQTSGKSYLFTFYYHPCFDVVPTINASGGVENTCLVPLALCRHTINVPYADNITKVLYELNDEGYEYLGSSNIVNGCEFAPDGGSIKYNNGPSSVVVLLTCADTPDKLQINSLDDPSNIILSFYSRNACLKQIEDLGRSLESTLCIIFFSFIIFYLVLGICMKKFLMGATGVPNLMFWSDLPKLVKDGWALAVNRFKILVRGTKPVTNDINKK